MVFVRLAAMPETNGEENTSAEKLLFKGKTGTKETAMLNLLLPCSWES